MTVSADLHVQRQHDWRRDERFRQLHVTVASTALKPLPSPGEALSPFRTAFESCRVDALGGQGSPGPLADSLASEVSNSLP
jgi:hypothetical protein